MECGYVVTVDTSRLPYHAACTDDGMHTVAQLIFGARQLLYQCLDTSIPSTPNNDLQLLQYLVVIWYMQEFNIMGKDLLSVVSRSASGGWSEGTCAIPNF